MAVPVGSYFLAYNIFPEVYQAHWTSKVPFSSGERAVTGQGGTQHIGEKAADGVAHVVFLRRWVPDEVEKIRNREFSDLRKGCEQEINSIAYEF